MEKNERFFSHGLLPAEHGLTELREGTYVLVVDMLPNLYSNRDLAFKDFTVTISSPELLAISELKNGSEILQAMFKQMAQDK
jgi:hypothetical protein